MKILAIVSGLDFENHTRRSTLEAIHKLNPETDILLYNSVRNLFVPKKKIEGIKIYEYHFWILENLRKFRFLQMLEYSLRRLRWKSYFSMYKFIFIIDPNQYYLLPYLNNSHKIIYLLRDPSVLQNPSNYNSELCIIKRANAILAISENLKSLYFYKHYGYQPENVFLWSNAVDLDLWDNSKFFYAGDASKPVVGMAGNINQNTDLQLIKFLLVQRPDIRFEIAGKLKLNQERMQLWQELLEFKNLFYHGYIPFEELPGIVSQWDAGLLLESKENEYSYYYNHNKIYQYMALGKPFVSYKYNNVLQRFSNVAFTSDSPAEFLYMLDRALERSRLSDTKLIGLSYAKENSAKIREKEFLEIIKSLS